MRVEAGRPEHRALDLGGVALGLTLGRHAQGAGLEGEVDGRLAHPIGIEGRAAVKGARDDVVLVSGEAEDAGLADMDRQLASGGIERELPRRRLGAGRGQRQQERNEDRQPRQNQL